MYNLTAHHLRFSLEVESPIELDHHQGSALRGMLFNALRGPEKNPALGFCVQRHLKTCAECPLVAVCPVASLVATLNPQAERGQDVPRPYAIVPPLGGRTRYETGTTFTFGLTLFGEALNLFPYVVMALRQAGAGGLGKQLPPDKAGRRWQRGRFTVRSAQAINLLSGEVQDILQPGSPLVQRPELPVTHEQVAALSEQWLSRELCGSVNGHGYGSTYQHVATEGLLDLSLEFRTPARIVTQGVLLKEPEFSPIFQRLLERLAALSREFGRVDQRLKPVEAAPIAAGEEPFDKARLLNLSDQVALVAHQTRWQELWSHSARQQQKIPIGGLMGRATYRANREVWAELLPYLLWGTVIHVGKNAVKGDGIIAVSG
jgi:hypothetical protein